MTTIPQSDSLNYVDPDGNKCNLDPVNTYSVGIHAISAYTYEKMINDYYMTTRPPEYSKPVANLRTTNNKCTDYVEFNSGDETVMDNTKITVEIKIGTLFTGKYSIHFFRGLEKLYPTADYYEFSKARGQYGNTLVMRVVVIDKGIPVVVYRGDLTHMYP